VSGKASMMKKLKLTDGGSETTRVEDRVNWVTRVLVN
jgi:hypothetical protein